MALEGWRFRAANFFFLIVVFGPPLFNVPCSKGTCSSPVEVVADYMYANNLASDQVVKALLYPSALLARTEVVLGDSDGFSLPNWKNLLRDLKFQGNHGGASMGTGFVLACTLCLLGAFLSPFGLSFLSSAGMLVVLGYIYTAGNGDSAIYLLPMFSLAILCAIASVEFSNFFRQRGGTVTEAPSAKKKA